MIPRRPDALAASSSTYRGRVSPMISAYFKMDSLLIFIGNLSRGRFTPTRVWSKLTLREAIGC